MGIGSRLAELLDGIPYGDGEYLCRCPICGDSNRDLRKRRFSINIYKDKFQCFNCGEDGGYNAILNLLFQLEGAVELTPEVLLGMMGKAPVTRHTPAPTPVPEVSADLLKILRGARPLRIVPKPIRALAIRDMLHRKAFTYDELLNLTVVPPRVHGGWDWRVVVPVEKHIFQGKSLHKKDPKYLSPPGMNILTPGKFPNWENCVNREPIVASEGILDFYSFPIRNSAVAVGSRIMISDDFIRPMSMQSDLVVMVCDADPDGFEILYNFVNYSPRHPNVKFYYPNWLSPSLKDPNDLLRYRNWTKEDVRDFVIENAVSPNIAYIRLKDRMGEQRDRERTKSRNKHKGSSSTG